MGLVNLRKRIEGGGLDCVSNEAEKIKKPVWALAELLTAQAGGDGVGHPERVKDES